MSEEEQKRENIEALFQGLIKAHMACESASVQASSEALMRLFLGYENREAIARAVRMIQKEEQS